VVRALAEEAVAPVKVLVMAKVVVSVCILQQEEVGEHVAL
jgi:hypothetical protein